MLPGSKKSGDWHDASWRSLWLSSFALSFALLGDALIYIVLPVNADLFGVSLAWVGILLAANRIVRTFSYGMIAMIGERIGFRALCLIASGAAIISTGMYSLFEGWAALLIARVLWGLSYGALLLVSLGYAVSTGTKTGTRVGVSRGIEQVGPLFALTAGAWLAGILGPRDVFAYLALISCVALIFAFMLPPHTVFKQSSKDNKPSFIPRPDRLDILIFWMGFGVDGIFTMTITIIVAKYVSLEMAMLIGGSIIAGRRVVEMLTAPIAGVFADRFGVRKPLIISSLLLTFGLVCVGVGWLSLGVLAIIIARGSLGTLIPAAVSFFSSEQGLKSMARNQTWRDIGAALGPLSAGFLLVSINPEVLHLIIAVVFVISLLWLMTSPLWGKTDI